MTSAHPPIGPSPFGHSQTIVQLYHELATHGFGAEDLRFLCRIHQHGVWLFAGQLRPSGRPFTCHTVGTASVVARHGGSLTEIAAALLHAAYEFGDSGSHVPSAGGRRRRDLIAVAGEQVEAIVNAFYQYRWPTLIANIPVMDEFVAKCSEAEKSALFLRLCNDIEQLPDLPFSDHEVRQRWSGHKACFIAIAESLGRLDLAQLYDEGLQSADEALGNIDVIEYPYVVSPASYTKRLSARLREFAFNRLGATGRRAGR